jgi:hypothetical protein
VMIMSSEPHVGQDDIKQKSVGVEVLGQKGWEGMEAIKTSSPSKWISKTKVIFPPFGRDSPPSISNQNKTICRET